MKSKEVTCHRFGKCSFFNTCFIEYVYLTLLSAGRAFLYIYFFYFELEAFLSISFFFCIYVLKNYYSLKRYKKYMSCDASPNFLLRYELNLIT